MRQIISVSGLIGSGKDTIADYLITEHGFKRMSWAATLKDTVSSIFGWDREMLDGVTADSRHQREQVDQWWADRLNMPNLTPRWVLQYTGTEVFRNHFHQDTWVASLENQLRLSTDNIVVTDSRFANEVQAIKRIGGTAIRVVRGPEPSWTDIATEYNNCAEVNTVIILKHKLDQTGVHASEYSHVGLDYDAIIQNNSTISDLRNQVKDLLLSHRSAR